jgi:hypothetical protein
LPCVYCKSVNFTRPNGIDRVDNTLGYELGNVIPCCSVCNRAKSNLPLDYFLRWYNTISAVKFTPVAIRQTAKEIKEKVVTIE